MCIRDRVVTYLKKWCVRGVCSQERGHEKGNLHLQIVPTFGVKPTFATSAKLHAAVRKHMREKSGIASKDRIKVVFKQLEGIQNWDGA